MHSIDRLVADGEAIRARAGNASAAADGLARAANGTSCGAVPAPVGYDLPGNVKVLLWYVREATAYLPRGLARSLQDDRIVVYDRDFATGQDRDPVAQVEIATVHLERLNAALGDAAAAAEAAQSAISGQGYNPAPTPTDATTADRPIHERVLPGSGVVGPGRTNGTLRSPVSPGEPRAVRGQRDPGWPSPVGPGLAWSDR